MSALLLRCKSSSGTHRLTTKLYGTSTVKDLQEAIKIACGVREDYQKLMCGYPPKPLNLKNSSATLNELNIKSGDTFTLVNKEKTDRELPSPGMKRKEVPADNSCLFYSVFFAVHGHLSASDYNEAKKLRVKIANVVLSNPDKYSEAFLGRAPTEYAVWIQCDTSWGGGIELSILSENFQLEIAAIDIKTLRVDNYGQIEKYGTRIFLLYDGIHYDPMFLDPENKSFPLQTIFPTSDDAALVKALQYAEKAHRACLYTDVANFTLRCLTCNTKLTGQKSAQEHAKNTGHGNFGEIQTP